MLLQQQRIQACARPAQRRGRKLGVCTQAFRKSHQQQTASTSEVPHASASRRTLLGAGMLSLALLPTKDAEADVLDLVRNVVRPQNEYTPTEAVVVLMDARSTLREVKVTVMR
eukprot:324679-Pelagomonas_calceolata.AAC.1